MIKLYTHASYYKPIAKFSTWIYTIAKNNALTELRKNKRKRTDSLWTNEGKPIDIIYVPASKLEQRINKKIAKLRIKSSKIENIRKSIIFEIQISISLLL